MNDIVYGNETTLRVIALVLSIVIWLILLVATVGTVIIYALLFLLIGLFTHSALIAYLRGNGVLIGPRQFPDLHERLRKCCGKLGMSELPEAYVVNGNGTLNAFATKFLGRNFVVLLSDVVDSMEERPDAIDFYIGHELGHLNRKHHMWSRLLWPALLLPVLGAAYSRACEYTCDRHGLKACDNGEDAQYGLVALAAGKHRWRQVNLEEFAYRASLKPGFWMSLHELVADYPWLNKRLAWLRAVPDNTKPKLGRRNPFSWFLSLFVPHLPGAGASGGLVIIAFIAILAAIAIPQYQNYLAKSYVLQGIHDSAPYRSAIEDYAMQNRVWPTSLADAGLKEFPGDQRVKTITLGYHGSLLVTFRDVPLRDKQLTLTPYVKQNQFHWKCEGSIPRTMLPMACHEL